MCCSSLLKALPLPPGNMADNRIILPLLILTIYDVNTELLIIPFLTYHTTYSIENNIIPQDKLLFQIFGTSNAKKRGIDAKTNH